MTKHDAVLWYSFGSIKSLRYLFPPLHNASGPKPGGGFTVGSDQHWHRDHSGLTIVHRSIQRDLKAARKPMGPLDTHLLKLNPLYVPLRDRRVPFRSVCKNGRLEKVLPLTLSPRKGRGLRQDNR